MEAAIHIEAAALLPRVIQRHFASRRLGPTR